MDIRGKNPAGGMVCFLSQVKMISDPHLVISKYFLQVYICYIFNFWSSLCNFYNKMAFAHDFIMASIMGNIWVCIFFMFGQDCTWLHIQKKTVNNTLNNLRIIDSKIHSPEFGSPHGTKWFLSPFLHLCFGILLLWSLCCCCC